MGERRSNRPTTCEFSKATIMEALRGAEWKCERCGITKKDAEDGYFEAHHILGVMMALRHHPEIAHALIASLANCQILCKPCHKIADREDPKRHCVNACRLSNETAVV